jgi:hypothetical protein
MTYPRKWFLHLGIQVCEDWCPDCSEHREFEAVTAYLGAEYWLLRCLICRNILPLTTV